MSEQLSICHEVIQCGQTILLADTTSDAAEIPGILWAMHDDPSCQRPFLLYIRSGSEAESHATREELSGNVEMSDGGWCEHTLQMSDCEVLADSVISDDQQDIDVFLALVKNLEAYKWYHQHVDREGFTEPINIYTAGIATLQEVSPHPAYGDGFQAPRRTGTMASQPDSMISDHSSDITTPNDMLASWELNAGYDDYGPPEAGSDQEERDLGSMSDID